MTRDQAIAELSAHADALRARGVAAAYLVCSARPQGARHAPTATSTSSSTWRRGAEFSLLDLAGVHRLLNEAAGRKFDVTTRESLHPKLRSEIEREAVRLF